MITETGNRKVFKYNLSFYYQSTIIYFVALVLYAVVKGEFFEGSFKLITRDPVIYFFLLVVVIAIGSLLYNLYLNRHIEFTDTQIIFKKGSRTRKINIKDIERISLAKGRQRFGKGHFRILRIRVKNKRLPVIIIPYDYENRAMLLETLKEIRNKLTGNKDNV